MVNRQDSGSGLLLLLFIVSLCSNLSSFEVETRVKLGRWNHYWSMVAIGGSSSRRCIYCGRYTS